MPLPANFWTTGWQDIICHTTFTPASISVSVLAGQTIIVAPGIENLVYAGGLYDLTSTAREAGLLYGRQVGDQDTLVVFQYGAIFNYMPHFPLANASIYLSRGRYVPPFSGMTVAFGGELATEGLGAVRVETLDGANTYDLFYWQPLTIIGTIAEVLGAMLMYAGADPDTDIDQDSFSDAYDDMLDGRPLLKNQPFVWFRAVEGETVGDSLKKVVAHCSDFLTVNLAGKIALISRRVNRSSAEPITPGTVIGDVEIDTSLKRMVNKTSLSHGQWGDVGAGGRAGGYDPGFENDPSLFYFVGAKVTPSVAIFGHREWGKEKRNVMVDGKEVSRSVSECPYFYYSQQKAILLARIEDNESNRSTLLTVTQGLIGADYGVGYEVENVEVDSNTGGGDSHRCVHQHIDFNNLEVTSKILQEYVDSAP